MPNTAGLASQMPVGVPPVTHRDDKHDQDVGVNLVEDVVVTGSDSPFAGSPDQPLSLAGTRLPGE